MSDPVPDVAPAPSAPTATAPTVASPNSFFIYLIVILAYLVYHRISWEAILLLFGSRLDPKTLMYFKYVWLIPVAGILGSIVVPSIGTTTLWLVGSSVTSAIPLVLAFWYVLLFGNRRDQSV